MVLLRLVFGTEVIITYHQFSAKCVNAGILTDGQVRVLGFTEPAVEDSKVVFACPAGLELSGSNTSICTGNGEWEPDPTILTCTGT